MSDGWGTVPEWRTGDLVSAAKLNDMMDAIDAATGLQEQRVYPFDAGANIEDCVVYGRPTRGFDQGSQVEYWLAHNGDQLVVKLSGTDPAYLYWRWDGVTLNNADAVVPAGSEVVYNIGNLNNGQGLAGLYPYQPVRLMLRSTYHPNASIFVDYVYQKNSNAPTSLGTLPAFTNGTTSAAADLNAIRTATTTALATLQQPIACQYSNDDRVGTRNFWRGWIRHTHSQFIADITVVSGQYDTGDLFYIRYNGNTAFGWMPGTPGTNGSLTSYDGPIPPVNLNDYGLNVGDWYLVEVGFNRTSEHEQHVTVWSMAEVPNNYLGTINSMTRWTHGDVLNGSAGGPPRLAQMTDALDDIGDVLRWVNQPCRTAGSIILDEGDQNCVGAQIIDSMSSYRVHRWLAYNTFLQADGNYANPQIHWFSQGRTMQSYSLPRVEAPAFFDLESTPIKPGMWFRLSGVGFGIQTPEPGINYA